MRRLFIAWSIVAGVLLGGSAARADSRVAFEMGGVYAYSPLGSSSGSTLSRVFGLNTEPNKVSAPLTQTSSPGNILAFEVRPTFFVAGGLRLAVGFRAGRGFDFRSPSPTRDQASVLGGDVSIGFGRKWGRLLPYIEARFGFNDFSGVIDENGYIGHRVLLRLDGVVGTRVYLSRAFFVNLSAFGGLGDRYGGALALGLDIVHFRWRGKLP